MNHNAYLLFDNCCAAAFTYYAQHLDARVMQSMTYSQMPNASSLTPEQAAAVLHARLQIGNTVLMASDAAPGLFKPMEGSYLALICTSDEEAERFYAALLDGGTAQTPLQETFFATRYAQLRDRFGMLWMIVHERPMPSGH
jgi:PhnB protein